MPKKPVQVATVVLAGGQGTRLLPLTLHHSKPAVSYGGRYRLIDIPISNSINSDFRQIFVIVQYRSDELQHHLHQTYQFDHFNPGCIDILIPQEDEHGNKQSFLGTADAVRKSLPTILKSPADYFLILSGDQLYNINFQEIVEFAGKTAADLTIVAIPVRRMEAERMGLLQIDASGKVLSFVEKPTEEDVLRRFALPKSFFSEQNLPETSTTGYLGSMGIYVFQREALIALLQQDQRTDFGFHLIDTAVKNWKTYGFVYHGYWEDIGTISSYYEANLMLTHGHKGLDTYDENNPIYTRPTFLPGPKIQSTKIVQSIICEGSIIEAAEITHSVIGLRSHIREGTIIRDTVMMGNHLYMPPLHEGAPMKTDFWIGKNCLIEKAIIDEHVQIGNNVQLINAKKLKSYDGDGVFIREGIIIVTAGTKIPDGFIL
jgi:glucose-1-phosphate adenylyltransferase